MKRLVFLCLILLVVGCGSVFAQRGGGGGGGGRGGMMGGGGGNPAGGRTGNETRPDRDTSSRENRTPPGERRDGAGNGEGQPRGIGKALRGLDLSDAQKQQIRDIQKSAKENGTDRETVAGQIRAVLTPEQIEKLETRKEKEKERRENRRNQNSDATPPTNN